MGWVLRIAAVLLLFMSLGLGLWLVSVLSFVYLLISFRPRGGRKRSPTRPPARSHISSVSKRHLLAGFFAFLAVAAVASGGVASPFVFAAMSGTALLWPRLGAAGLTRVITPEADSILLRRRIFPFAWYCLVEVKFGTGDPLRSLPAISGPLMIADDGPTRVYTLINAVAFGHSGAERKVVESLRTQARAAARRGGYLLPLDSVEASARLRWRLSRVRIRADDLVNKSGAPPNLLILGHESGFVREAGAFAISGGEGRWAALPGSGQTLSRHPLLWEVLKSVGEDRWPPPDEVSGFLGSMSATRGEATEDRLRGEQTGSGFVLHSAGGESVVLSRAQLRAVASIYD